MTMVDTPNKPAPLQQLGTTNAEKPDRPCVSVRLQIVRCPTCGSLDWVTPNTYRVGEDRRLRECICRNPACPQPRFKQWVEYFE